jgi:hypothetical protein
MIQPGTHSRDLGEARSMRLLGQPVEPVHTKAKLRQHFSPGLSEYEIAKI